MATAAIEAGVVNRTERRELLGLAQDVVAIAFLALLPALFFWRLLTPNAADVLALAPGDFTDLHFPYRLFETRELLLGHLPIWNPYVYGGESALGDIQYGTFYPLNIISSLLLGGLLGGGNFTPVDLALQIAAHFALASVFTYLFARRVLGSRPAALIAALTATYGGYLTSFPVEQVIILETSIWLPLILLFLDLGFATRATGYFVVAGMAAAIAITVGHPQTFLYLLAGALTYAIFKGWLAWRTGEEEGEATGSGTGRMALGRVGLGLAIFLGFALALAAVQLWPAFVHLQMTARTSVNYDFTQMGHRLQDLIGLLLPTSSGGSYLYIGALPLILAGIAFFSDAHRRQKMFWLAVAIVALVLGFGGQTFLYQALYVVLPGFSFFRNQERSVYLFTFALAMLSGYGARVIVHEIANCDAAGSMRRRLLARGNLLFWTGFLMALVALGAFVGRVALNGAPATALSELADRAFLTLLLLALSAAILHLALQPVPHARRRTAMALMIGLICLDLFTTNGNRNAQAIKPEALYPSTATIQRISIGDAGRGEAFRISSEGLLPGDGNAGAVYSLEDIVGNSPLELRRQQEFEQNVDEIRRWQLLNVKYVLTKRKTDDGRLIPLMQEGAINAYELAPNLRLSRAYVVSRAVVAGSEDEEWRLTKAIDPHQEVVLAQAPGITLPEQSDDGAKATILQRSADSMEVQTSSMANGVLVLSQIFYPGWEAHVDGQPVPVLRADSILQGIPLEKGTHTVQLTYAPASLRVGEWVSLGALALAIIWIITSLWISRGRKAAP